MEEAVRFKLSDRDGVIRFATFDVVSGFFPEKIKERLTNYLIGKPLADVTCEELMKILGSSVDTDSSKRLLDMIGSYQQLFMRQNPPSTAESVRRRILPS